MKIAFAPGKNVVKTKRFTFMLNVIPEAENRAERYSITCWKEGEPEVLYTDWSHRFFTHEEAAQFCARILRGELDYLALCKEAKECRESEEYAIRVMKKAKQEEACRRFWETAESFCIAPEALHEILWTYANLPPSARDTVLGKLEKDYGILPHIELTLPQCDHCGHYGNTTRRCHACDGVLDMSRTYGPEYHAPKERVRDIGCKRFSLEWQGSYACQQRLTVWFYNAAAEPIELGDVLVHKNLDVRNKTMQTAIKRQIILDKLFENDALYTLAEDDLAVAINALKLDIWYWCAEEKRARRICFHE